MNPMSQLQLIANNYGFLISKISSSKRNDKATSSPPFSSQFIMKRSGKSNNSVFLYLILIVLILN